MNVIRILILLTAAALTGCASTHAKNPADPLESFNRGMYQFNDALDKAIIKPVAQGYGAVMPTPGKIIVNNFFSNLDDLIVTINDLLQFKFTQAASDGSRFLFNTTFGIFGLLDVADRLEKHNEDFGQTLGYWGVGNGPYIVLPIFGPSTLRDGIGLIADNRPSKLRRIDHMRTRNQMFVSKAISHREQILDQEKVLDEAAIDRYEFIRDAYLLRRKSLVYDGNPPREKYDDEENDTGTEKRQTPIINVPSAQNSAPVARPISSNAAQQLFAQQSFAPAAFDPHRALYPQDNVHKVWVAQRTGIR
jgi:phospholipid-binding lipoprotein MlaA